MSLVQWVSFPILGDERGSLTVLESEKNIPFEMRRVYYIANTMQGVSRGFHAHKTLRQIAVCVSGRCKMLLDDGCEKAWVWLEPSSKGLFIEPYVWHEMHEFSSDCVLLVIASDYYDEADYIRDYDVFSSEVKNEKR